MMNLQFYHLNFAVWPVFLSFSVKKTKGGTITSYEKEMWYILSKNNSI